MLDRHAASDRAVRYAIRTGQMPNVHLIHAIQGQEGFEPCFGRAESQCSKTHCRWHEQCAALTAFSAVPSPDKGRQRNTAACLGEELGTAQAMTLRGCAEEARGRG